MSATLSPVTSLGRVAVVAGVLTLAVGIALGWAELRVVGLACLVAFAIAVVTCLGRQSYQAQVTLDSQRVKVGEEVFGSIVIRNTTSGRRFRTTFEVPVGKGRATFGLPTLGRDEHYEQKFRVPTRRRGVVRVGPVRSVRSDPLMLMRRVESWSEIEELYVHPDTILLRSGSSGFLRDIEGITTQQLSSSDVSFHALRDYQRGDDRRAVHWRTTARLGRLVVRQFEETRRAHLLVLLSLRAEHYANDEEFELAVSCAGSLAAMALREDRKLSVHTQGRELRPHAIPLVLDQLSGVETQAGALGLAALTAGAVSRVPNASVIAIVTGSATDVLELRAARAHIPIDIASFALRCGAQPRRASAGDLTVLDIAQLGQLPRAIREV